MLTLDLHRVAKFGNMTVHLRKAFEGGSLTAATATGNSAASSAFVGPAITDAMVVNADETPGALGQTMLLGCTLLNAPGASQMLKALDDVSAESLWMPA